MRRLSPSEELLAYLDYELEGKAPPVVQPPRRGRGVPRRAALAVAALAIVLTGIGVASLAFAQDAGTGGAPSSVRGPATRGASAGDRSSDVADSGAELPDEARTVIEPRHPRRRAPGHAARGQREEPDGEDSAEVSPLQEPLPPGERSVEQEDAGLVRGESEVTPSRHELAEVTQPCSPRARPLCDSPGVPPLEPSPAPQSDAPASTGMMVLLVVLLLAGAAALVVIPPVRRRRAVQRGMARAARLAVESRRGGRRSNEDRSAAFTVDDYDVLIVADGMGGHIGGARAALIAVETAANYLARRLPIAEDIDLVEDLVRSAFIRAANALAAEDAEIGLGGRGVDALRTTLIVVVATAEAYVVGAQGDGGAWVQRATGISMPLMTPAKGDATNIVTASLGPSPEGQVEITRKRRMKGDLLVVCTDGVADRVGLEFDEALRAYADDAVTANEIVGPILDSFEERPTIFDDNVTLGVLVTP